MGCVYMKNPTTQKELAKAYMLNEMHETLVMEVDDYIRKEGLSKTDFAKELGVSKSYLSQFLNGRGNHTLGRLISVAIAIGKHPHIVFSNPARKHYTLPTDSTSIVQDEKIPHGLPQFLRGKGFSDLANLPVLGRILKMQEEMDTYRPLPDHLSYQILQKFRLAWTYNSNAIEGNALTYGETLTLIRQGITAKGKPFKDHQDIKGHEEAVDMLLEMIKGNRPLNQHDVRQLHELLLVKSYPKSSLGDGGNYIFRTIHVGEYKRQPNHVRLPNGSTHYYAPPIEVPSRVSTLLDWYNSPSTNELHPLLVAAIFHHEFVAIHPFDDGNGRMGRILMNYILMRRGYPPIVVPLKARTRYYSVLNIADMGDYAPLLEYLAEHLETSLQVQLDVARDGKVNVYEWDN